MSISKEAVEARLVAKFPRIQRDKLPVKNYPSFRLSGNADLLPVFTWLRDEMGFSYLHMLTATDWLGDLDLAGYIREPNPNVFLPEGATPQLIPPRKNPGVEYRNCIEVVYALQNLDAGLMVFLKLDTPRDGGTVPSVIDLFPAADWQEREVFDLFGVRFEGHPNCTKILTPEFIEGHPLRKDYAHKKDRFDD